MSSAFAASTARGRSLLELINAPFDPAAGNNNNTTQSPFTSFDSLATNNWHRSPVPNTDFPTLSEFQFEEFFTDIKQDPRDILSIDWIHPANGVARFCTLFNVKDGTIFSTDRVSPQGALDGANKKLYHAALQPEVVEKPALEHWSDVMFLQWVELCEKEKREVSGAETNLPPPPPPLPPYPPPAATDVPIAVKSLRRVVICNIKNNATKAIIKEVYGTGGFSEGYPGRTFTKQVKEQEEFVAALLGTVNARGVGYLLAQHKAEEQFGRKSIESVQIFRGGLTRRWFMVFLLGV